MHATSGHAQLESGHAQLESGAVPDTGAQSASRVCSRGKASWLSAASKESESLILRGKNSVIMPCLVNTLLCKEVLSREATGAQSASRASRRQSVITPAASKASESLILRKQPSSAIVLCLVNTLLCKEVQPREASGCCVWLASFRHRLGTSQGACSLHIIVTYCSWPLEPLHIKDSQEAQNLHACTPGDDSEHSVLDRPSQAQEGGC